MTLHEHACFSLNRSHIHGGTGGVALRGNAEASHDNSADIMSHIDDTDDNLYISDSESDNELTCVCGKHFERAQGMGMHVKRCSLAQRLSFTGGVIKRRAWNIPASASTSPKRRVQMFSLLPGGAADSREETPAHSGTEDEDAFRIVPVGNRKERSSGGGRSGASGTRRRRSGASGARWQQSKKQVQERRLQQQHQHQQRLQHAENEIFECEFDCGFEHASEQLVESHELSCTKNPNCIVGTSRGGNESDDEEERELKLLHDASLNPYTVHVVNGGTGEIKTFASATLASVYLNCDENEIFSHLHAGDPIKGFSLTRRPIAKGAVQLTNQTTKETLMFEFVKDAAKFLECTSERLLTCLRKGLLLNNWIVRRVYESSSSSSFEDERCRGPLHFRVMHKRTEEVKIFKTFEKAAKFIRCTTGTAREYIESGESTKKGWQIGRCDPPRFLEHIFAVFPKRNRVDAYACACGKRFARGIQLYGHRASCHEMFVCRGGGCGHTEEALSDMRTHETTCTMLHPDLMMPRSETSSSASLLVPPTRSSSNGNGNDGDRAVATSCSIGPSYSLFTPSSSSSAAAADVLSPVARSSQITLSKAASDDQQRQHQREDEDDDEATKPCRPNASDVGLDINTIVAAADGLETGDFGNYKEMVVRQVKRKQYEVKIDVEARRVAAMIANSENREWSRLRGRAVMFLVTHSFTARHEDELSARAQSLVSLISDHGNCWAQVQLEAKPIISKEGKILGKIAPDNYRIRGDAGRVIVGLIPWNYLKKVDVIKQSAKRLSTLAKLWPGWSEKHAIPKMAATSAMVVAAVVGNAAQSSSASSASSSSSSAAVCAAA